MISLDIFLPLNLCACVYIQGVLILVPRQIIVLAMCLHVNNSERHMHALAATIVANNNNNAIIACTKLKFSAMIK